jgi:choline-sulfatase
MVRLGPHKLIRYHGFDQPQLFDLNQDPDEAHDLAGNPALASLRQEMERHLHRYWDPQASLAAIAYRSSAQAILHEWSDRLSPPRYEHWHADPDALELSGVRPGGR